MNKLIKTIAFCLAVCCTGMTYTACSKDDIKKILGSDWLGAILSAWISTLTPASPAETAYQGDLNSYLLGKDKESGEYHYSGEKLTYAGTTCVVGANNDGTYYITIPGHNVGAATMSTISFYYLVKDENGKLDLGDNSTYSEDATLTIGGNVYSFSNLYIECTHTEESLVYKMSIYFDNDNYVVNLEFSGNKVAVAEEQPVQ